MFWAERTARAPALMWENSASIEELKEAPGFGNILRRGVEDSAKRSRVWIMEDLVGHSNNFHRAMDHGKLWEGFKEQHDQLCSHFKRLF